TRSKKLFPAIELHSPLKEVSWSRNGRFLLTLSPTAQPDATRSLDLAVWESETGHRVFLLPTFNASLSQVAVSDDGQRVVCYWTNAARLYDLRTGQALSPLLVHKRIIHGASFSANGEHLLTLCRKDVNVWNLNTRQ